MNEVIALVPARVRLTVKERLVALEERVGDVMQETAKSQKRHEAMFATAKGGLWVPGLAGGLVLAAVGEPLPPARPG